MQVSISALTVGYQGKPLIGDIHFDIAPGQIVTLIGPNGAGKSTILKTIANQLRALAGQVCIVGKPLPRWRSKALAKTMSLMLTERISPDLMTCYEVVSMGRYPYTDTFGRLTPQDHAVVRECITLVGADDFSDRLFSRVSDGQRQRILLARALCQQPRVLVLDEPTSFLDIHHKIELLSILRTLATAKQVAVLLSLHEIDLAAKISDRLLCVAGDRIALSGTPEEVFQDRHIQTLYHLERGSYNTLFGSVELHRPQGESAAFLLAGNGTGIPLYRLLQKHGMAFDTGILFENDVDFQVAKALASQTVSVPAFEAMEDTHLAQAKARIAAAPYLVHCGVPIRAQNAALQQLIHFAQSIGKPVCTAQDMMRRLPNISQ